MILKGHRAFTHNNPTTYKRITPERGCGFILKRIYDLTENPKMPRGTYCKNPTKQDVYCGTSWAHRPGFASLLWSSLLEDELIASDDGMEEYDGNLSRFAPRSKRYARASGHYELGRGYTVRYHLTAKGRGILFDMMDRVGAKNKTQPKLNAVGSVAEYDVEKDLKVLEKLADSPPPEILQNEATDSAKLAASYAAENQKLRAKKDDLYARLKKISARLEWLDDEISDIRNVLAEIIGW